MKHFFRLHLSSLLTHLNLKPSSHAETIFQQLVRISVQTQPEEGRYCTFTVNWKHCHQDSVFTSSSSHNKINARLEHMSTDDWRSWIHTLTRLSSILSVCVWIHVFHCRRHVFVVSCRTDSVQLLSVCLAVGCFTELYLAYTHHCFFFLFLQRLGHLASIHLSLSNMCSSLNGSVHLTRSSMHTSSHRAGIRLNSFYWQMLRVSECLM